MIDPVDDRDRLAALFRDAASDADAPPPSFGHSDVVAASRRITARRRSAAVGAAAVLAFVGVGAAVVLPGSPGETTSSAASAPEVARDSAGDAAGGSAELSSPYSAESGEESGAGSDTRSGPAAAPVPAPAPAEPPLAPGGGACADRQDPGLRALVEEVLPEVAGAAPAPTIDVCLPPTDRYLSLEVADGTARGVLTVSYLPPGSVVAVAPGFLAATTASGGTVLVGSTADGADPAPYADRLSAVLDHLAPRL